MPKPPSTALVLRRDWRVWRSLLPRLESFDYNAALRTAYAFCNGADAAITRIFGDPPWQARRAIDERYSPTYEDIRNYLIYELEYDPTMACAIAMKIDGQIRTTRRPY